MVLMPIIFWLIKADRKAISGRIYGKILVLMFPICTLTSILLSKIYTGTGILLKINSLISNRFALANKALNEYGISLFGKKSSGLEMEDMDIHLPHLKERIIM